MATHEDSSRADAQEGDTPPADTVWRTETSRYFRRPGGWWWAAFLGVPLALALTSNSLATVTTASGTSPHQAPAPGSTAAPIPSATPSPLPATSTPTSAGSTGTGPSTTPSSTPTTACDTLAADLKHVAGTGQIRFGYKSNKPTPTGLAAVAAAARLLTSCPSVTVTVRGFADLTGPAEVNKKISVRRAQSVRTHLRTLGVTNQLTVTGLGDTHSVANNSSAKGRAANRRAEIVIP